MSAFIKSVVLVVAAVIWLVLSYSANYIYQTKRWLKQELDITLTWLELLRASAFFLSGLTITGLVLSVLQN